MSLQVRPCSSTNNFRKTNCSLKCWLTHGGHLDLTDSIKSKFVSARKEKQQCCVKGQTIIPRKRNCNNDPFSFLNNSDCPCKQKKEPNDPPRKKLHNWKFNMQFTKAWKKVPVKVPSVWLVSEEMTPKMFCERDTSTNPAFCSVKAKTLNTNIDNLDDDEDRHDEESVGDNEVGNPSSFENCVVKQPMASSLSNDFFSVFDSTPQAKMNTTDAVALWVILGLVSGAKHGCHCSPAYNGA